MGGWTEAYSGSRFARRRCCRVDRSYDERAAAAVRYRNPRSDCHRRSDARFDHDIDDEPEEEIKQSKILDKFKGRLCACGNELAGDVSETYSPTIGALTYATVHQLAIIDRMESCVVDRVGAYLYQDYLEGI